MLFTQRSGIIQKHLVSLLSFNTVVEVLAHATKKKKYKISRLKNIASLFNHLSKKSYEINKNVLELSEFNKIT